MGTINPAYILARLKGFDIREQGSKNAGASNALIMLGKTKGGICAAFDIAKAILSICLTGMIFESVNTFAVTASSCILGHIFPFYMGFRGGKGLACLTGAFLALDLRVSAVMLVLELIIALTTRYICFVPITASAALPFIYGFLKQDLWGALLLGVVTVVIWCKHAINIHRILQGKEMRLTYLWNRDRETERLKKNYEDEN